MQTEALFRDLAHAFEVAKKSDKPLLVVLRCIPCEECVKLDDELMREADEIDHVSADCRLTAKLHAVWRSRQFTVRSPTPV